MDDGIRIPGITTIPTAELRFVFTRSDGPGGQNVNKVATRVELVFDINQSRSLSARQKAVLMENLPARYVSNGVVRVASQESRSQWTNRELAVRKLVTLIQKALTPRKKRVATKPTAAASLRRRDAKRHLSRKKSRRRIPEVE
jgi:ribosome-associated protein